MNKSIQQLAVELGVGKKISRQKVSLTNKESGALLKSNNFSKLLLRLHNYGSLTKFQQKDLERYIYQVGFGLQPMNIVSIFCPSYKRGTGEVGYNSEIGPRTRANIKILSYIKEICQKYNIPCTITIYFSDLLLENYSKLITVDYKSQLNNNYNDLVLKVSSIATVRKLSELGDLASSISTNAGNCLPIIDIDEKDQQLLIARNRITYQTIFGWSEREVRKRTTELINAYPYLAKAINYYHPNAMYYWSETAIERVRLMPNLAIPLFMPKKVNL